MSHYQLPSRIPHEIFRAYDIRGVVEDNFSAQMVYALGLAMGTEANERHIESFVLARDGRISSPTLLLALKQGLLDSGRRVVDIGLVPTPVLYFAEYYLKTDGAIMLTGSHNPSQYNGIKAVFHHVSLDEATIQGLYQRLRDQRFFYRSGHHSEYPHIASDYIENVTKNIHLQRPLKIVVDTGHGAAGEIAPALYRHLGCEVIPLFNTIDGNFPDHHPDPSVAKNLEDIQQAVVAHRADLGLAFDGDADRLGIVSHSGKIIWPDRQMMLFALNVLVKNPGAEIIFDVKSSRHLADVIRQAGGVPMMWKTGHSLLKAKMAERQAPLAGEMSGHICFKDRWYGFDDALYAGARFLEIVSSDIRCVDDIFSALPDSINTPELKIEVDESHKMSLMRRLMDRAIFPGAEVTTLDGLRADFKEGWGLVRASNTTACLTVRFEANDQANLKRIQNLFREQLLAVDAHLKLPF